MTAAVVVHYGSHGFTQKLLPSLESKTALNTIIIVLHSSLDGPLSSRPVYLEEANKGYAAGLNRAVRYLQENHPETDTVLAMNPDIELEDGALERLLETHSRERADATFPSIREGKRLIRGYAIGRYGTVHLAKEEAHLFPGTCFLFSIEGWKKAGGFNERYFHYFEDLDFCEKIYRQKGKICHDANVIVNHIGKSGASYPATSLPKYAVRNHLLFIQEFGKMNRLTLWNVSLRHLFYLLRWPAGWRGIQQWYAGIREFREGTS